MAQDFECENHGSIALLRPLTDAARDWCDENLPEDAPMLGNAYAIEMRYFGEIAWGFQEEGLTSNVEVEYVG